MESKEEKHALYLVKDGEKPKLFHADDVEDAQADGWKQPDFPKSNGTDWNAEEDLDGQTAAAEFAKQQEEADAKKAADKAKDEQKAREEAEKSRPDPEPDMRVQVVEPKKAKK